MERRLVQILGDDIEELYEITNNIITDEMIKAWFEEYSASDSESFEDFIDEKVTGMERVFVDEIIV